MDLKRLKDDELQDAIGIKPVDFEDLLANGMPSNPFQLSYERTFHLQDVLSWLLDEELERGRQLGIEENQALVRTGGERAVAVTVEFNGSKVPASVLESDIVAAFRAMPLKATDKELQQ